jgi:hypothetical protein
MSERVHCANCKHATVYLIRVSPGLRCKLSSLHGEFERCSVVRSDPGKCGELGNWFEPHTVVGKDQWWERFKKWLGVGKYV